MRRKQKQTILRKVHGRKVQSARARSAAVAVGECSIAGAAAGGTDGEEAKQRLGTSAHAASRCDGSRMDEQGAQATSLAEDSEWEVKFEQLKAFKREHGHPHAQIGDVVVGVWVKEQRQLHKEKKLPLDREEKLIDIGCVRAAAVTGGAVTATAAPTAVTGGSGGGGGGHGHHGVVCLVMLVM